MTAKRKSPRGTIWNKNHSKFMDDSWHWIEGRRGKLWFPLYCVRAGDVTSDTRARTILASVKAKSSGGKVEDGLSTFVEFRLHPAGEWMTAEATLEEARNVQGGYALSRLLRAYTRCGKRRNDNSVCLLPPKHEGKHNPHACL